MYLSAIMPRNDPLYCPFCPFENDDEFLLIQHVETVHPESGESPLMAKDSSWQEPWDEARSSQGKNDEDDYIECLCGEFCLSNGQSTQFLMYTTSCIAS